jgi:hypothetical protein
MTDLDEILSGAHGVWAVDASGQVVDIAVWHGGHTVNSYRLYPCKDGFSVNPTGTASVGDFETGETSRSEAKEAAGSLLSYPEGCP